MKRNLMEFGRSMVEMLGVLAIIGVLSIMGIQGYKKAMMRIDVNEAWDSAQKFKVAVEEFLLFHLEEVTKPQVRSIYLSEGTNNSTQYYLGRTDLKPNFATKMSGFNIATRLAPMTTDPYIVLIGITQDGFCRMMLPDGSENPTTSYHQLIKSIDGVKWICRTGLDVEL